MAEDGICCNDIGLVVNGGDDGSAPQVAIFDIFISYFNFGAIWGRIRTLLKLKDVGSLFLGDPDGSKWPFLLIIDMVHMFDLGFIFQ